MKKTLIISVLIAITSNSFSQQTNNGTAMTKQDYLQKSKNQKMAAFIMLGAGITCFAIAVPGNVSLDIVPTLVIGGGVLVIGSIPLFIASGKNKRKAISLSFKNEMIYQLEDGGFVNTPVPSLTLKVSL
ncbi:MAG: hypothetical protein HZB42_14945 [Sphingobacteriales bacterium]|nr:hypothetical protein [Sphingobacteriales bacterium]